MASSWTFGRKVGAGFAVLVCFTIVIGVVAVSALRSVVEDKDRVIDINAANRLDAEKLNAAVEAKMGAMRGYLLAPGPERLDAAKLARADFQAALDAVETRWRVAGIADTEGAQILQQIRAAEEQHQRTVERLAELRRDVDSLDQLAARFDAEVVPARKRVGGLVDQFIAREEMALEAARQAASDRAAAATRLVVMLALGALLLGIITAVLLTRALSRQIGAAVGYVQSSSSELQAAANQQASSSKEQATAMNEISTTINELLATSKQIAESAQRVARIAEDTAKAARAGEATVERTGESIGSIKRQVDLIVAHMLDLGRKSQQIGGILELINELSEQTNILAINATIEAAGAGESGKRFGVVADEIRKLADRVGGSTKEIRGLIDEIRASVNATVMTTEGGSKAVDAGTREFAEVAVALGQISSSVTVTTEAAREIQLSTKQQSTAVEQVNIAISNVAQATHETEASASQTLQTASQLNVLSRDLMRLIEPQASR
ncbi:MAG: methyl-accepting chemotaxis protein [Deltaproteobacteria bacterium]|nr:methyl-accepting chemotaxis protein [Deltaproteobacteria bacterium]MCB9785621.1 methyl-accepting chemotaxis protein [Deltaproteobacteria bacterium]